MREEKQACLFMRWIGQLDFFTYIVYCKAARMEKLKTECLKNNKNHEGKMLKLSTKSKHNRLVVVGRDNSNHVPIQDHANFLFLNL